ncbi:6849_t:CDS:2 [Funneliformis geosporum]|nr:6849_t:CDS:2 [Funneliformis geosporum]
MRYAFIENVITRPSLIVKGVAIPIKNANVNESIVAAVFTNILLYCGKSTQFTTFFNLHYLSIRSKS